MIRMPSYRAYQIWSGLLFCFVLLQAVVFSRFSVSLGFGDLQQFLAKLHAS